MKKLISLVAGFCRSVVRGVLHAPFEFVLVLMAVAMSTLALPQVLDAILASDLTKEIRAGRAVVLVDPVDAPVLEGEAAQKAWAVEIDGETYSPWDYAGARVLRSGKFKIFFEPDPSRFEEGHHRRDPRLIRAVIRPAELDVREL